MPGGRMTHNPLAQDPVTDPEDRALVLRAKSGDAAALEELVVRHQAWIYNIAVRMLYHPQDAEDATQEILVKALTALSSYEGRSRFRTWLYRIVVNHVLNTKRGRLEPPTMSFSCYAHGLDRTADFDPPDQSSVPIDVRLLVEEARLSCTAGMALCLDREQRLIYILGEIFEVTDGVGSELLEISRDNFRQKLARARRDLHNFMNERCGLVNRANPCRCANKTRGFCKRATSIRTAFCLRATTSNGSMKSCGPAPRRSRDSMRSTRTSFGDTPSIRRVTWCRR